MEIILATSNPSKAAQIRAILTGLDCNILTLPEAGIVGDAVEDGSTLQENATKKALFAWEQRKSWCMADDTGIFIDALEGLPGIHAARWAGDVPTDQIMEFTLEQLDGVPREERTATFRTAAVLITPSGDTLVFTGELHGTITETAQSANQPKMPYSAIFKPNGYSKVWSEMTTTEENLISHRGQAFTKVKAYLQTQL
jgi:XTP/dITP diphosphohydrolase